MRSFADGRFFSVSLYDAIRASSRAYIYIGKQFHVDLYGVHLETRRREDEGEIHDVTCISRLQRMVFNPVDQSPRLGKRKTGRNKIK